MAIAALAVRALTAAAGVYLPTAVIAATTCGLAIAAALAASHG